jgi:selenoprotein W-related protein
LPRAVSLADDFLSNYQHMIEELILVTSSGGAFEVKVNDELIFSKKTVQKRHAEPGEVIDIFRKIIGDEVHTFPS